MIAAVVVGNLGQAAELRHSNDGNPILNFSIASNMRVKKGAEWVDATTWVRCVIFGKRAESLAKVLDKGSSVVARGTLSLSEYEARDGTKKSSLELRADDVSFAPGGRKGAEGGAEGRSGAAPRQATATSPARGGSTRTYSESEVGDFEDAF